MDGIAAPRDRFAAYSNSFGTKNSALCHTPDRRELRSVSGVMPIRGRWPQGSHLWSHPPPSSTVYRSLSTDVVPVT